MSDFDSAMMQAIGPLKELGFALHWLKPRDKFPVRDGWQNAKPRTLEQLIESHSAGQNLGVMLGAPSCYEGAYYLYALDLDIRDADAADDCWTELRRLFPDVVFKYMPTVVSGSGGESRHIYFYSDQKFTSRKIAHSPEKVKLFKKSKNRDVWTWTWEIELFGTGKQVVLPPSIHPETHKPYYWLRQFDMNEVAVGLLPFISGDKIAKLVEPDNEVFEFETKEPHALREGQIERILADLPMDKIDDYESWVMLGQALHHQFGGSQRGFDLWMEASKRSDKFNEADLRQNRRKYRGFGRQRRQPVTLSTVREWAKNNRILSMFGDDDEFEPSETADEITFDPLGLNEESDEHVDYSAADAPMPGDGDSGHSDDVDPKHRAAREAKKMLESHGIDRWTQLLEVDEDGKIKATMPNVRYILQFDPRFQGIIWYNELKEYPVMRFPPKLKFWRKTQMKPCAQPTGDLWKLRDELNGNQWTESHNAAVRYMIELPLTQGGYGIKVPDRDLDAALLNEYEDRRFHPVVEYLEGLKWDGKKRVETFFIDHLGTDDNAYYREIALLFLIAAVARAYEPGIKFDSSVILEGGQGLGKSTFIRTMAKHWGGDLEGDFHDRKVMGEKMSGLWIIEMPELTNFNKSDVEAIKAFFSATEDRFRPAYARVARDFPRRCVFMGSTNNTKYLRDETGNRRFWPCKVGVDRIDAAGVAAVLDQVYAEAVALYREMRQITPKSVGPLPLYLKEGTEAEKIAKRMQDDRRVITMDDSMRGEIEEWLDQATFVNPMDEKGTTRRAKTCAKEIFVKGLGGNSQSYDAKNAASINRIMESMPGWKSGYVTIEGYGRQRGYIRDD